MNRYVYRVDEIPPSLNKFAGTKNVWQYRNQKKYWTELIYYTCRPKPQHPIKRAVVTLVYFFPTNHRHDPDNYNGKFILDGLTRAGIIEDDSFDNIELRLRKGGTDKKRPHVDIVVEPLEEI